MSVIIRTMNVQIALLAGITVGLWLAYINVTNILLYAFSYRFKAEGFEDFFKALDTQEVFDTFNGTVAKLGYDGYQKVLNEASPQVDDIFRQAMRDILKFLLVSNGFLAILPALLLGKYAVAYLTGIMIMYAVIYYRKFYIEEHDRAHALFLMQALVIRRYLAGKPTDETYEKS